jgi:hypothetical protein
MATTPVIPALSDASFADIRTMLSTTEPAKADTKTETSEPVKAAETQQTATETVETKQEPEGKEEPLPEGVQKRIAKEVEKATRIQAEIDKAVSTRKAREAELATLTKDASGSQPVKPAEASDAKPKRAVFGEAGHENETYSQFEGRQSAAEDARDEWIRNQAVRDFEAKSKTDASKAATQAKWDAAVTKHGKDFPDLMTAACAVAPEGMQLAISGMKDWDTLAVHLAKNPAQLKEIAAEYAVNSFEAVAKLGRIRDALISKEPTKAATAKALPDPIAVVGGTASASGQDLQSTIENGSFSTLKATITKIRGK